MYKIYKYELYNKKLVEHQTAGGMEVLILWCLVSWFVHDAFNQLFVSQDFMLDVKWQIFQLPPPDAPHHFQ